MNNNNTTNYDNTTSIINNIKKYIINKFNITSNDLYSNKRYYLKELLKSVRDNNNQVKLLRIKREKIRQDIKDLECSMVGSQSFDDVQAGRNNGLIPNTTELKYMHRLELKEQLSTLALETQLIEKSLEDNNKLISEFIDLLSSSSQRLIMKMTYIECMTNVEIASTLFYSVGGIDKERWRALKKFEELISQQ